MQGPVDFDLTFVGRVQVASNILSCVYLPLKATMGKVFDELTPAVRQFVLAQKVFFVGTAPLSQNGHVNVSPKGLDGTFVFLNKDVAARATTKRFPADDSLCTVVYLDVGGSGIETVAHLLENERITLMFCAFEGSPKIVRFSGTGLVFEPHDEG